MSLKAFIALIREAYKEWSEERAERLGAAGLPIMPAPHAERLKPPAPGAAGRA